LRSNKNEEGTREEFTDKISPTKGKSAKMLKMITISHNTIIPVVGLGGQ
jgi:hypothetical protein